jgi:hypothetical protein
VPYAFTPSLRSLNSTQNSCFGSSLSRKLDNLALLFGRKLPRPQHPCAAWTSQQIIEAFAHKDAPHYLRRDRDRIYGNEVRLRISSLQIEEVLTAPRSPWQNPYVERLIGSIRRDCLDHFIIFNARHLKRT